jgi:soluble lytic murein transglycosylase-like protein
MKRTFALMLALLTISSSTVGEDRDVEAACEDLPVVYVEEQEPEAEPVVVEETPVLYPVPLDEEVQLHIIHVCEKNYIDPSVIMAMIDRESDFRVNAMGDKGQAFGLMQIQPKWHQERMDKLGVTDLLDPVQNVTVGIDYLVELLGREKGLEWALMAYNGGQAYANKLTARGIVSDYAEEILANAEVFAKAVY